MHLQLLPHSKNSESNIEHGISNVEVKSLFPGATGVRTRALCPAGKREPAGFRRTCPQPGSRERTAGDSRGTQERLFTSLFDIPCSIFDIRLFPSLDLANA
jgi:hypothetical protein